MTSKQKKNLIRIIVSFVLFIILAVIFHDFSGDSGDGSLFIGWIKGIGISGNMPATAWIEPVLYLAVYLIAGYDVLIRAGKNIARGQVFDENFLMIVAGIGAFVIGEYSEGVAVMIFYQTGELFQSYAVGRSRQSITAMMEIVPEFASVVDDDGGISEEDPEDVEPGTTILIKPGEKVPIDCRVIEGDSYLDTSALTGESVPRHAGVGSEILSGCINGEGTLKCVTTKEYKDSAVSVILELVENAGSRKSKTEKFITRFAKYYTPVVTVGALLLAVIPSLITGNWMEWLRRACTFLVISCPCALVVSVPLGFFGGIGAAAKLGIMIKGSNYLEAVSEAAVIAFDKTGTLTHGDFSVTNVFSTDGNERRVLELAAAAEQFSNHPIAGSILKACREASGAAPGSAEDARNITGKGVSAVYDGKTVLVGNTDLMKESGINDLSAISRDLAGKGSFSDMGGTVCHVAYDGKYCGCIVISDTVKESAAEDIAAIRLEGVEKTVMLTGDNNKTAAAVAARTGVDAYFSQLLPADKVSRIEELMGGLSQKQKLMFVGDGINDAPVLIRSDIGIAMGKLGSDAAIEAADIVIMDDDLGKIPALLRISGKTLKIVRENIVFALVVKFLILILGALGIAGMWLAVFADVGVAVLAILNSMRTLKVKDKSLKTAEAV
ncbi:MAG: heavy metal translocating P-type ATPase [Lachnospiraceae bacterium]|nr:heavy metal translocating P-type ATPase [Lachnospiraceae bacterium]